MWSIKTKNFKMMKNKLSIVGIAVLALGLALSGCATDVASVKMPTWDKKPIGTESHDYTILGTVKLEKSWIGVLGSSIDILGIDSYLYQKGGVTYADLLEEAQKNFPEADAVIDVKVDYSGSTYAFFYSERKNIVTGLAIKYVKEPRPNNPALDVRLR